MNFRFLGRQEKRFKGEHVESENVLPGERINETGLGIFRKINAVPGERR